MPDPLSATFTALSDPTRLAMVRLLAREARRPSDIAEQLQVSRAVTSRHLRILHRAGVVDSLPLADDARGRIYALSRGKLGEVRGFLDELEAFWTDQLSAFKDDAERGHRGD